MRRAGILALAVLVLAVLLAGGILWWLTQGPTTGEEGGATTIDRPAEAHETPALVGRGTEAAAQEHAVATAWVRGTVRLGGRGVPAEVEARLLPVEAAPWLQDWEQDLSRTHRMVAIGALAGAAAATARADENGRFQLEALPAGSYEVRGVAEGREGFALAVLPAAGAVVEVVVELASGPESLRGRAVHRDGTPFRGTILAQPWDERTSDDYTDPTSSSRTETDAEGRFDFVGLNGGTYVLNAIVPGRWRVAANPIRLPLHAEYLFVVDQDQALFRGRLVADAGGKPVAGATVLAYTWLPNTNDIVWARVVSDEDGRFSFSTDDEGCTIGVQAAGFAPLHRLVTRTDEEVVLRLVKSGRLEGRVVTASDGRGVAGVPVLWLSPPLDPVRTVSGPDGRYALEGLAPGGARIFALGNGWASEGLATLFEGDALDPFERWLGVAEAATLDLRVVPCGRAILRVKDASGRPVPATVRVTQDENVLPPLLLATDAEGQALADALVPGIEVHVEATATAGPGGTAMHSFVPTSGEQQVLDLVVPAFRVIEVLVRGVDGAAATGARVGLTVLDQGDDHDVPGVWFTDSSGLARVEVESGGRFEVSAQQGERRTAERTPVAIAEEGGAAPRVVVTLTDSLAVEGRVDAPEGFPFEAILLYAKTGSDDGNDYLSGRVRPDGTFRISGLLSGLVTISANCGRGAESWAGEVSAAAGAKGVLVPLVRSDEEASGFWVIRVLDPTGKPVERASAYFRGEGYRQDEEVRGGMLRRWFNPDEREKRITVEVADARDATGAPLGTAPGRVGPARPKDGPVEIRLEPGTEVRGRVLGPDGEPVVGLLVKAVASGGWTVVTARTDVRGQFRLGGLDDDAGTRIHVGLPRGYLPTEPMELPGRGRDLEIRLRRGISVTVRVLGPDGQPQPGARVTALPPVGEPAAVSQSDSQGFATLAPLDPQRTYVALVYVQDAADVPLESAFDLARDGVLRLTRSASIDGVVRDMAGSPVKGAMVWRASGPPGRWIRVILAGENGVFTAPRLPEGPHRLRATRGDEPAGDAPGVAARAGAGGTVVVPLE